MAADTSEASQSYIVLPPGYSATFDPNMVLGTGYGLQVEISFLNANINASLIKENIFCPISLPTFFLIIRNEPELGAGIYPGMALTPFISSFLELDEIRTHNLLIVSQVICLFDFTLKRMRYSSMFKILS
jgi:hypothetical protein